MATARHPPPEAKSMSQKLGCTSLLGRHGLHFSAFDDPLAFSSTLLPEFYYDMGIVVFLMNVGTTMQPPNHVNLSTVFQFVLTFSWAFWSWCIHVYFNILLDTDDWSYRLFTLVTMIATVITSLGVVQRIDSASTCIFALGCGLSETLVLFSWLRAINIDGAKTTSRAMILSRLVSAALSFTAAYTPYTPTSSARYVYLTLALFFSMLGPVTVITSIPVPNHFKLAERMYGFVVLVCGGCMFASMNFLVISNEMLQEEGQPLTASISSFPASFVGIVVLGLLLPYTIVLIYGTSSPEYAKSDYTLQNDNTLNRRASVGGSFFRAPQRGGSAGTPLLLRQKSHVSFSVQHSISRKQRLLAFVWFYSHLPLSAGIIGAMCAIGTLDFHVSPIVAPYFTWDASGACLFSVSFGVTLASLCVVHLVSDRSEGGNVERAWARGVSAVICFGAGVWAMNGSHLVEHPLTHLFAFCALGLGNAYYDSLGFLHYWGKEDPRDEPRDVGNDMTFE